MVAAGRPAEARTLDALVFIAQPSQVVAQGTPPALAQPIDASRVPALATAQAQRLLRPFLGRTIDADMLTHLRAVILGYFVRINRPYTSVTVPEQDVTEGTVQVLITQATLGAVHVVGNRWFAAKLYAGALRVQPGEEPDSATLDADVAWLNQNPYRRALLKASAGTTPGTTDLTIEAEDQLPVSFSAGVDDTGNPQTGLTRLSTGFDWGNAFFRGDDLNFAYTTSGNSTSLRQYTLAYTTYLPSHASLSLSATNALSQAVIGASPLATTGFNTALSLRYDVPLPNTRTFSQEFTAGADYKTANNNLLFGGVSVFPTTTVVDQLVLGYSPSLSDRLGSTSLALDLYLSPGGLSPNNSDATFATQQAGALANYAYANVSLDRTTRLGAGWTWRIHAQEQFSSAVLLPSEELPFGGYGSVRGFTTAFATRDEGELVANELHARPFSLGVEHRKDRFDPYLFVDYGAGWNHGQLAATYLQMITYGPGFEYRIGTHVTARFDYGFVMQHLGLPAPNGEADLGVQYRS